MLAGKAVTGAAFCMCRLPLQALRRSPAVAWTLKPRSQCPRCESRMHTPDYLPYPSLSTT